MNVHKMKQPHDNSLLFINRYRRYPGFIYRQYKDTLADVLT
jgi:hypothetical protein